MFLIIGATGHIGGATLRTLHERGYPVRAFVRDIDLAEFSEGVAVAVGNLDRPETLGPALEGVTGVFHMQVDHGTAQTEAVIAAARAAGVERIVALSSKGAALDPMPEMGAWFAEREKLLHASGISVSILRPGTLMTNNIAWAPTIKAESKVEDPVGPGRLGSVDTDDVGACAAVLLTQEGHAGKTYTLTGAELLTVREQVAILSRVLGRDIRYVERTPGEVADAGRAAGQPAEAVATMQELNEMLRADRTAFLTDAVEQLTGCKPTSFEAFYRRNVDLFH